MHPLCSIFLSWDPLLKWEAEVMSAGEDEGVLQVLVARGALERGSSRHGAGLVISSCWGEKKIATICFFEFRLPQTRQVKITQIPSRRGVVRRVGRCGFCGEKNTKKGVLIEVLPVSVQSGYILRKHTSNNSVLRRLTHGCR